MRFASRNNISCYSNSSQKITKPRILLFAMLSVNSFGFVRLFHAVLFSI